MRMFTNTLVSVVININIDTNIKEATDKLKGTFMSLVNCGLVHSDGLHPLSYKKIYEAVVLHKALYGSETWFSLFICGIVQVSAH